MKVIGGQIHVTQKCELACLTDADGNAVGPEYGSLDRVTFIGELPFEVKEVHAVSNGFELTFTKRIKVPQAIDRDSFPVSQFTYLYHASYGSPEIDHAGEKNSATEIRSEQALVSSDRLKVRLIVSGWKAGGDASSNG